jgi:hypothetical protein
MRRTCTLLLTLLLCAAWAHDEDGLERLAKRLLAPWGGFAGVTVELFPGALPSALPFDLPFPPELEVVGSLSRRGAASDPISVQVVLDSPLTTEQTLRAIQALLAEPRWESAPVSRPQGFLVEQASYFGTFCSSEADAFIHLSIFPVHDGPADVRVDIVLNANFNPCAYAPHADFSSLPMPALYAPPQSHVVIHHTHFMEHEGSTGATLRTAFDAPGLQAHYEAQLAQAGWQREGESGAGRILGSIWRLELDGERWEGILSITTLADGRHYANFVLLLEPAD